MNLDLFMTAGATFSADRVHRYRLWRQWGARPDWLAVCGLNPSTADEQLNDPTIRRCIDFAKLWGFSGLMMVNAFAFRSTDPAGLLSIDDPVGPENDEHIVEVSKLARRFVFAWGRHAILRDLLPARAAHVFRLVREYAAAEVGTFGSNGDGSPRHPLYLARTTQFIPEGQVAAGGKS